MEKKDKQIIDKIQNLMNAANTKDKEKTKKVNIVSLLKHSFEDNYSILLENVGIYNIDENQIEIQYKLPEYLEEDLYNNEIIEIEAGIFHKRLVWTIKFNIRWEVNKIVYNAELPLELIKI